MVVDVTAGVIRALVVSSPSYKHALRLPIFHEQTNEVNKMEYLIVVGVVGAIYVNHCAMLKSTGMAITFTAYFARLAR